MPLKLSHTSLLSDKLETNQTTLLVRTDILPDPSTCIPEPNASSPGHFQSMSQSMTPPVYLFPTGTSTLLPISARSGQDKGVPPPMSVPRLPMDPGGMVEMKTWKKAWHVGILQLSARFVI
jgi:hypothetical protein